MTQDEIIEMARQIAGMITIHANGEATYSFYEYQLKTFANLIAQHEREACAKECWKQMELLPTQAWTVNPYEQCIDAIRARGQA